MKWFLIVAYVVLASSITASLIISPQPVAAATTSSTTTYAACEPGTYSFNESGSVICLPAINSTNTTFFAFSTVLNGTSLYVYAACTDPRGCNLFFIVMDKSGSALFNTTKYLGEGKSYSWDLALPSAYQYVVINLSVNNYVFGPYAIVSVSSYVTTPMFNFSKMDPRVAVILMLATVGVPLAVILRHSPKESGIALIAISFIYAPIMIVFGIPAPIPYIVCAICFFLGVFLIATTK